MKKDEAEESGKKATKRLEQGASQAESTFHRKLISEDPEGDCAHNTSAPDSVRGR